MLETVGQVAHRPRDLGLDAVAATGRRRRMVRLVEDQQAPRPRLAEPLAHRVGVGRIDQQVVRHQEPAVGAPRIDPEAPLTTHPRHIGAVEDLEYNSPKRSSISPRHCSSIDGGAATTIDLALRRNSSSRAIRPASMVLPKPVSSAISRLTRGRRRALRNGSIW